MAAKTRRGSGKLGSNDCQLPANTETPCQPDQAAGRTHAAMAFILGAEHGKAVFQYWIISKAPRRKNKRNDYEFRVLQLRGRTINRSNYENGQGLL